MGMTHLPPVLLLGVPHRKEGKLITNGARS